MSRRSGQDGYIERKGNNYVVRFWMDVPGQEKRAHKSVRICPVTGPGKLNKSQREHRAREIITASGADSARHFNAVQAVNLGTTFQQQAEWWLEHIQSRKREPVKFRTAYTWASHLKWINRKIGAVPLVSVNNLSVKQLITEMVDAGFTAQTVKCYVGVVKQVVASAVDENGEEIYPRKWNHDFLDMPLVTKHHTPTFTPDQVTAILDANTPYRILYAILAGTGMRIGEALGLEVGHISQDGYTISIRQTLWGGSVASPKTNNAVREIDLHPSLAALLMAHLGLRQTGFVFQSSSGRPLQPAHVLRFDLHPILAGIGASKTGFHAFRRFRVTHLRKHRVPEDLLRFWIGHADKSVTDGYSKVKEDAKFRREVANVIPLGFELLAENLTCVPNVPKQLFRTEGVTA